MDEFGRNRHEVWAFHVKQHNQEIEKIVSQTAAWGYAVSSGCASRLVEYGLFLGSYEKSNVIGTREITAIVEEHILDSLSCMLFGRLKEARELVDVGSGGGLPGLPLTIAMDELKVSLVESTFKKTQFLKEAMEQIGASNSRIVNARAEDIGQSKEFRSRYDVATARALASLDVLAEYCLPLVRIGGHVVAMKAHVEKDELDSGRTAAKLLGGEIVDVIAVERLPEYEQKQRHLVVIEKVSETPGKYPRRTGMPAQKPLGEIGKR